MPPVRTLPGLCRQADRWIIRQVLLFGLAAVMCTRHAVVNLAENRFVDGSCGLGGLNPRPTYKGSFSLDMLDADITNSINIYNVATRFDFSVTPWKNFQNLVSFGPLVPVNKELSHVNLPIQQFVSVGLQPCHFSCCGCEMALPPPITEGTTFDEAETTVCAATVLMPRYRPACLLTHLRVSPSTNQNHRI